MGLWLFEQGILWTSATLHQSFETAITHPPIIFYHRLDWVICLNVNFHRLNRIWSVPCEQHNRHNRCQTGNVIHKRRVIACGLNWDTHRHGLCATAALNSTWNRGKMLSFPTAPFIIAVLLQNKMPDLFFHLPLLDWIDVGPASLPGWQIYKGHTVYSCGEVYSRTVKLIGVHI